MERVLHNQRMTRHLGRHMDEAGRVVGQSFEAAAHKGITYEEQTRYGLRPARYCRPPHSTHCEAPFIE